LEFQIVYIPQYLAKHFRQTGEQLSSLLSLEHENLLIGIFHIFGKDLHPRQFSVEQECKRIDPTLEFTPPRDGGLRVGSPTTESERSAEALFDFFSDVFPVFDVEAAELKIR
jgi:hypothetical protein